MNKDYYEEIMDNHETWRELVVDLIRDKLDEYKGMQEYGCDLAYKLFEEENVNGSFTCSHYWSRELIKKYWDDFAELNEEYKANFGEFLNPFEDEKFVVIMLLKEAQNILSQCKTIDDNWNDKFTLDEKKIKKINKELDELVD